MQSTSGNHPSLTTVRVKSHMLALKLRTVFAQTMYGARPPLLAPSNRTTVFSTMAIEDDDSPVPVVDMNYIDPATIATAPVKHNPSPR